MARDLLTAKTVEKAKPRAKAYRLRDGDGLFLYVPPSGISAWQFRYKMDGVGQTLTLGKADRMTLAQARVRATEARDQAAKGMHLTAEKRVGRALAAATSSATFAGVADAWVAAESRRAGWTEDYCDEVDASIRNHLDDLFLLPVAKITAAIAAPVLRRCEHRAPDMAKKVRQRLRAILDHAVEDGLIAFNPLPAPRRRKSAVVRRRMPALLSREDVGSVLRNSDRADVSRGVYRAHWLAVVTAQRIGEIVPGAWIEFDLDGGMWSIPRSRMKRKDDDRGDHKIPLPPILLATLRDWRRTDGLDAVYVCPAPSGDGHITREAVEKFYRRTLGLSGRHSPHSWRSVLKSWAEDADRNRDAIEAQLDHAIGNRTEGSYDRALRINLRRELLTWYEKELLMARDGADVIALHRDVA